MLSTPVTTTPKGNGQRKLKSFHRVEENGKSKVIRQTDAHAVTATFGERGALSSVVATLVPHGVFLQFNAVRVMKTHLFEAQTDFSNKEFFYQKGRDSIASSIAAMTKEMGLTGPEYDPVNIFRLAKAVKPDAITIKLVQVKPGSVSLCAVPMKISGNMLVPIKPDRQAMEAYLLFVGGTCDSLANAVRKGSIRMGDVDIKPALLRMLPYAIACGSSHLIKHIICAGSGWMPGVLNVQESDDYIKVWKSYQYGPKIIHGNLPDTVSLGFDKLAITVPTTLWLRPPVQNVKIAQVKSSDVPNETFRYMPVVGYLASNDSAVSVFKYETAQLFVPTQEPIPEGVESLIEA